MREPTLVGGVGNRLLVHGLDQGARSRLKNLFETRWGISRVEFVCGVGPLARKVETARAADAMWRATDPVHRLGPAMFVLGSGLAILISMLTSFQLVTSPGSELARTAIAILGAYAALLLMMQTVLREVVRASDVYATARLNYPGPMPLEWLPEEATVRNIVCRAMVAIQEWELILTGQLGNEQLGPEPEHYVARVEMAAMGQTDSYRRFAHLMNRLAR